MVEQTGYRVFTWGEDPTWTSLPIPSPGPGKALIEVLACGVEAAELVAKGQVEPIVGEVVGPDAVLGLHQQIRSRRLIGGGALDWRS